MASRSPGSMADLFLGFRFVDVAVVISSRSVSMAHYSIVREQLIENKGLQDIVSKLFL